MRDSLRASGSFRPWTLDIGPCTAPCACQRVFRPKLSFRQAQSLEQPGAQGREPMSLPRRGAGKKVEVASLRRLEHGPAVQGLVAAWRCRRW